MTLQEKISNRSARVVVIGGGYVGRPLAIEIDKAGFRVVVYDTDHAKVDAIQQLQLTGATIDPQVLGTADVVLICVPTPLNKTQDPDNSFVIAAVDQIVKHV